MATATIRPPGPIAAPTTERGATAVDAVPGTTVAAEARELGPIASGLRDMLPIVVAVAPFGMVIGVAAAAVDVPLVPGLGAALLIYGGSAHLATLGALASGTAALAAALTGALISARLLLYSADLARTFKDQPRWFRVVGSLTIIEQTYGLLPKALAHGRDGLRRYWITIGVTLATGWVLANTAGAVLGDVIPPGVAVAAAPKAVFMMLLVNRLADPRMRRAVATAAIVAAFGTALPAGLGIIAALLAAMAVSPAAPVEEDV